MNAANVIGLDDQRERKAGFEEQRQKAVEALRQAAAEFRKLEELAERRPWKCGSP